MTFARQIYICKVTDRNGNTDFIEVFSLDDVPCKWVTCEVKRIETV